jgi:hypothetical protein
LWPSLVKLDGEGWRERIQFEMRMEGQGDSNVSFRTLAVFLKDIYPKFTSVFAGFLKVLFEDCLVHMKLSTATLWQKIEKKLPHIKFSELLKPGLHICVATRHKETLKT